MDAKQIAALARAGLTDDQIDTVVRVTAAAAAEPMGEQADDDAPAPHVAERPCEKRRRNTKARGQIMALIARSPCNVEYLARHAYGAADIRSVNCINRMVQRLIGDGFVSMSGGQVRLASGMPNRGESADGTTPGSPFTLKAPDANDDDVRTRCDAAARLCEAIRSDVVRAGGKITASLAKLTAPHRKLLEQTCVGLRRTSNVAFAQRISSRRGDDGSTVMCGLRFVRDGSASTGNGLIALWTVTAV